MKIRTLNAAIERINAANLEIHEAKEAVRTHAGLSNEADKRDALRRAKQELEDLLDEDLL